MHAKKKIYRLTAGRDFGEFRTSPHAWKILGRVGFHGGLNFSVILDHALLIALPSRSSKPQKSTSQPGHGAALYVLQKLK